MVIYVFISGTAAAAPHERKPSPADMSAGADEHFGAPLQQPRGVLTNASRYGGCADAD